MISSVIEEKFYASNSISTQLNDHLDDNETQTWILFTSKLSDQYFELIMDVKR